VTYVGAPYVPGSATSKAAAAAALPDLGRLEALVLAHITRSAETGATDDEIEVVLGLRHQSASARRRGLVQKKLVADSGRTRTTRSGRRATVWVRAAIAPAPPTSPPRPTEKQAAVAVADIRKCYEASGWKPTADVVRLMQWVNHALAKRDPMGRSS
jgi:hypothetical protein